MSEVVAAAAAAKTGLVRVVNVDFVTWVLVIMFVKKWEDKKLKSENVGPLFFVRLYLQKCHFHGSVIVIQIFV